ncbi:ral GTPase-activating protein subunit alpha-1-like [Liolophura sinensis]|uniref:ral GTPase-activating protein subunit alpha-1-like n=1 Tax=Liolophura sinensis TaxID=3198878 RepID=UPI003158CB33
MIWYQILQENASDDCHQMFFKLVPGLGDTETFKAFDARFGNYVADSYGGIIAAGEIAPIYLVTGEKQPENLTKYFLEALLTFMVSEVTKVEWMNKEMRETSFVFLFDKFKESYLKCLLPDFRKDRSVYVPTLEIPIWRKLEAVHTEDVPSYVAACQDSFIKWLANFAITSRRPEVPVGPANRSDEDGKESSDDKVDNSEQQSGSQSSTLTSGSQAVEKDSADSSLCSDEHSQSEYEIVRGVLYSTRENVNIVQEIFRQALLFSFEHAAAMKRVISVYKDWFQHVEQRPVFMQEPSVDVTSGLEQRGTPEFHHSSLSDIIEESSSGVTEFVLWKLHYTDSSPLPSTPRQMVSLELPERQRTVRNASYLGAIQDLADSGDESHMDVKAGLQRVCQVFITNAANVFLQEVHDENLLNEQVDLCKRVLNIYRYIVMNIPIQQQTWEQILRVLLGITSGVLRECPPKDKSKTLGGRLAQPIFQTLIVTWIKANLNVFISCKLWDLFLEVLSSLTHWEELIREWAKTMETLTRVLAKHVYNLDLLDLPLQRLSEQKEKRRRGRSQGPPKVQNKDKTFSRAILSPAKAPSATAANASPAGVDVPFERGKSRSEGK